MWLIQTTTHISQSQTLNLIQWVPLTIQVITSQYQVNFLILIIMFQYQDYFAIQIVHQVAQFMMEKIMVTDLFMHVNM